MTNAGIPLKGGRKMLLEKKLEELEVDGHTRNYNHTMRALEGVVRRTIE